MASTPQLVTPELNGNKIHTPPYQNGNGSMMNGVHWPPTPAEPPRTPDLDGSLRPAPRSRSSSIPSSTSSPEPDRNSFFTDKKGRARSMPVRTEGPHEQNSGPHTRARAKIRSYVDDTRAKQFPRLSKPVELMRSSYDTVVIGSGYGGAVAASRMARAGQSVCLLELGKERWPGEYPTGMRESAGELHCSGDFAPGFLHGIDVNAGDPTGMYHLIFGKGQNAIVCNGEFAPFRVS